MGKQREVLWHMPLHFIEKQVPSSVCKVFGGAVILCPSTISQLPPTLAKNKRGDEESLFGILRNSLPIVLLLLSENFKQRQSFPWVQRER